MLLNNDDDYKDGVMLRNLSIRREFNTTAQLLHNVLDDLQAITPKPIDL